MGSFSNFDKLCRLCGLECADLIGLFEDGSHPRDLTRRDLTLLIKKHIRVNISVQDLLPQQVCGPCVAKLDELVDFVNACNATQNKLKNQLKECVSESSNVPGKDILHEFVRDIKVEAEKVESQFTDDLSDEDYDPHAFEQRRLKQSRERRRRVAAPKGSSSRFHKKVQSKEVKQVLNCAKDKGGENTVPSNTSLKAKECVEDSLRKVEVVDAQVEDSIQSHGNDVHSVTDKVTHRLKGPVRCGVCRKSFSHLEELVAHSQEAHQLSESSYMCPKCPLKYTNLSSLRTHQRRTHQDLLQPCPYCNKLYRTEYLWARHVLVHSSSRKFSCDECGKKFKSKPELTNHKKIHLPNEKRYTHCCEVCGKRFTQKGNLENHLHLHTGNRRFSCEFCGRCFFQRFNMEQHRRIHTGEKPYVCDICGVRYARQGHLAMHYKQHAGEKPHKCQYCEKKFLRRGVLIKHENMHTDIRPYQCSYCEKSFRDQGQRKVHERLHTGERPFECQLCGRGFCESGNLRKHMRIHQQRTGSVMSATRGKNHGLLLPEAEHNGAPDRGSGFNYNPVPNATFSVPGLTTSQVSSNMDTEGSTATVMIAESVHVASSRSHSAPQAQEPPDPAPAPLSLLGGIPSHNSSLVTLHQEGSQGNTTLTNQNCEREEYQVASSSSYQPTTTWTVYHA